VRKILDTTWPTSPDQCPAAGDAATATSKHSQHWFVCQRKEAGYQADPGCNQRNSNHEKVHAVDYSEILGQKVAARANLHPDGEMCLKTKFPGKGDLIICSECLILNN